MSSPVRWCTVLLAIAASCADPVDKAAKKRIFSPEDPPRAVASAAEVLPPEEVATKSQVARRVLGMSAAEATERLGPHKFTAQLMFEWTAGKRTVRLNETRTLVAGAGGVSGDFHGTVENSRDQGLEVMRVHGDVYARNRHGKFRHRSRDRGMAEREREEIHAVLRDADWIFQGRMKLAPEGTLTHEGRTTWKYVASLGPANTEAMDAPALPTLVPPKGGFDETTRRRQAFYEKREPKTLQGEVLVDAKTSVVVKARLDGRLHVPQTAEAGAADLRVTMSAEVSDVGTDPGLSAPKDFLPDEDKPPGIAKALDRFGIPHGEPRKADAGVATDEPTDE